VDSELAESVAALKAVFEQRGLPASFTDADRGLVDGLGAKLGLPERYRAFLREADPRDVETATPTERIRLIPAAELEAEQLGYGSGDADNPPMDGWRDGWVVIGYSSLLGDPYFLDTANGDAEGDCPVMTAMSGADLKPVMAASNFACFVRILAAAMEVAADFGDDAMDPDDENIFREAIGPKIRIIDPAALRAGHWTS
jgi:hypothetical protein